MGCGRKTAEEVLEGLDLSGRTMVVTGANSGIGFETSKALAGRGARVFLACRNVDRGREAQARIRAAHPGAETEVLPLDLASLASVRRFADRFPSPRLDALVANAGLYDLGHHLTEDGFERTVGVCHVGHFLLARLMRDRLLAAAPSRLVVVASDSHRGARLDLERLPAGPLPLVKGGGAYAQAKLLNVLFATEWERRYGADGLHAASLHPGFVATDIAGRSLPARLAFALIKPFARSAPRGAATSAWAAARAAPEDLGGRYYRDCEAVPPSAAAQDPASARRLWEATERWVGLA